MKSKEKISIITAVFNGEAHIEDAIKSVQTQTYPNIEHIIIDGGSTDATLSIIAKYRGAYLRLLSEKDEGIYDAMNKGFAMATGSIIGILHSDDVFENSEVIERVASAFGEQKCALVYGDLVYVDKSDTSKIIRYWKSGDFSAHRLSRGWMPPHPTLFCSSSYLHTKKFFNLSYLIAADYDLIQRLFSDTSVKYRYIPETLVRMRMGGTSNKNIRNLIRKTCEDYRAIRANKTGGIFTLVCKNIRKIPQFFLRK